MMNFLHANLVVCVQRSIDFFNDRPITGWALAGSFEFRVESISNRNPRNHKIDSGPLLVRSKCGLPDQPLIERKESKSSGVVKKELVYVSSSRPSF
jgi:hypothetical protein